MSRPLRWDELHMFVLACEGLGIEPPASVVNGLRLVRVAAAHGEPPARELLTMSDAEVRDHVTDLSIREHRGHDAMTSSQGMGPGIMKFRDELAREAHAAAFPQLEQIVVDLQPAFETAAAPLVVAAKDYGFTATTDPGEVIDLADENASAAYRAMRSAWAGVQPIASFRILMSKTFDLSPTPAEVIEKVYGGGPVASDPPINWSVLFAAGDNWSLEDRYLVEAKRGNHLDWLALATGGLRLNTPDEARAKIAARR